MSRASHQKLNLETLPPEPLGQQLNILFRSQVQRIKAELILAFDRFLLALELLSD